MVDILILIVFGLSIWDGYRKGIIGAAFKLLTFFIALVIAFLLATPITNMIIRQTTIDETIQNAIVQNFMQKEEKETIEEEEMPQFLTDYINQYVQKAQSSVQSAKDEMLQMVAKQLTTNIIHIVVMIVLFLGTRIGLLFVRAIANWVAKMPVIKQFNKLGGLLYGFLRALVVVYIVLGVLSFVSPMVSNSGIIEAINHSILGAVLYHHNLLWQLFFHVS